MIGITPYKEKRKKKASIHKNLNVEG